MTLPDRTTLNHRTNRRQFLKVGIAGALALAVTRSLDRNAFALVNPNSLRGSLDLKNLANKDAEVIAALAPVILAGSLPDDIVSRQIAINEVVEAFDRTVAGLSPAVQREVEELLSLLTMPITRRFVVGISATWPNATEEEIKQFLERWRNHRFALLQQGYQALVRVMIACWYGNPLSWGKISYSGPPFAKELGLQ
jgi:hypothetical protein